MRKGPVAGTIAVLLLLAVPAAGAARVSTRLSASFFLPADPVFRDVYGGGGAFGAELAVTVGPNLEVWAGGTSFAKDGALTFTGEEARIRLTSLLAGVRYRFGRGTLTPYAGAALGAVFYRESSPIGEARGEDFALGIQTGVEWLIGPRFFVDARVSYVSCRVDPDGLKAQLGGLSAGIGVGLRLGRTPN